ncbi:hypothetical protein FPOAC2_01824 [Fusarium poae]|jgi:sugar phosphate permease|uniref:Major facilitator superfamily (MFS) profile domain-containing protein n=1 Tax=Fusarium poae TaxID=36050 RepID=A0A1B8B4R8_FUSPO|nr:hypothetical protein FPOAC1_001740 [Fusarium poae]KAG8675747.1 hypothetical protein FPOAC1_001740 [Fusarium poae]OBS27722.1 hypothetical protein FPOA_01664 [Fusarium poae]
MATSSDRDQEKGFDERSEMKDISGGNTVHDAAGHGHTATDAYGNALVQFDPAAERRLRWKLDLYTVPTVAVLYLFCFIDRANIGNARIAGMGADLGLQGYDYNKILSVFYISYILCEIPATVTCKWMGPGWFLPATSLAFGIVSVATAFCKTQAALCGVRFLLGIFEAGMLPGIAYYLSRWYKRSELTFRLSLYMVMAPLAGAFGGLLASAILKLNHFGGLHEWRMIFAIEGVITIGLSLISFVTLTDRPETARWLSQEEKELCIARVKSERLAQTEVVDGIDRIKLWRGVSNPITIQIAFIFLFNNITVQGLAFFLPTIVGTIYPDYSIVQKQLHSVPPYAVGAVFALVFPAISWWVDRRQIFIIMSAPTVIIGYAMFLGSETANVRYGACFLIASTCMVLGTMTNAHISANVVSDTARSSAIGLNVMFGNIGGLIATWSYLEKDKDNYPIGNGLNCAAGCIIFIVSISGYLWMKWDNRRRDKKNVEQELAGLSPEEIANLDWKHPGHRWHS